MLVNPHSLALLALLVHRWQELAQHPLALNKVGVLLATAQTLEKH
jgi:hypothetical protein